MTSYNREAFLRQRLNGFVSDRFGLPEADYYSRLDERGYLELKAVLSDINNILTMKVTLSFIHWLAIEMKFSEKNRESLIDSVLSTKPSTNGFDIEITDPIKLIAEVKCNVPINGGAKYGSAQRNGIVKDFDGLLNGKSKSSVNPAYCFKFMVFLDVPEIRAATDHLLKALNREDVVQLTPGEQLTTDKSYVTYIPLDA